MPVAAGPSPRGAEGLPGSVRRMDEERSDPRDTGDHDEDADREAKGEPGEAGSQADPVEEPEPDDEVDEWGYESFPASDPPQH